ncbi:MAG: ABC transporter ATP-binding protein [Candidatus Zixiibacteriota bacterium]
MSGLILKSISKSYGKTKVLEEISLELSNGELLVLLGPSGCGKTTLLRLIAGLEKLDSGEILVGNRRIDHLRPKERKIAMVFQNYSLYPHMSVEKNLAFPLKAVRVKKEEIKNRVATIAKMLGLQDRLKDRPSQLSGGQRQRVALGRAVIREPSLFLLDEPLSNLDADLRIRMRQEIIKIQRELKTTAIHVTHDQVEALTMADRIALLHKGKIVQFGKPEDLYNYPNSLFVAQFIGYPRINILEAKVKENLLIPFGLPVDNDILDNYKDKVLVGIRPEFITIETGGKYNAVAKRCEYTGEQYVIGSQFAGRELVISGCQVPLKENQNFQFNLSNKQLLFFDPLTKKRIN